MELKRSLLRIAAQFEFIFLGLGPKLSAIFFQAVLLLRFGQNGGLGNLSVNSAASLFIIF
jgi:hypothetical protein